jgi:hypothetical protein
MQFFAVLHAARMQIRIETVLEKMASRSRSSLFFPSSSSPSCHLRRPRSIPVPVLFQGPPFSHSGFALSRLWTMHARTCQIFSSPSRLRGRRANRTRARSRSSGKCGGSWDGTGCIWLSWMRLFGPTGSTRWQDSCSVCSAFSSLFIVTSLTPTRTSCSRVGPAIAANRRTVCRLHVLDVAASQHPKNHRAPTH